MLVVEKSGTVGPGLAYATPHPGHLINMPAATMGLGDAGDFDRWRTGEQEPEDRYPARSVYGRYLISRGAGVLASLALRVRLVTDEVVAITDADHGSRLRLASGCVHAVDQTVLALGALPPTNFPDLDGTPGYFGSPWPPHKLLAIDRNDGVVVLGSSLTAVDAVRTLVAQGHRGPITFLSRHGLLPRVQGMPSAYRVGVEMRGKLLRLLDGCELRWDQVLDVLADEITGEGEPVPWHQARPLGARAYLQREIEAARTGRTRWQAILASTSDVVELLWNAMPIEERLRFDRDLRSLWMSIRHAMPLPNALYLEALLGTGQLRVVSGGDVTVTYDDRNGRFEVCAGRHRASSRWVVNCTGAGHDLAAASSPLLRQLLDTGRIVSHPCGGVAVTFDTFRPIECGGTPSGRLFAVGPLTRGVHFYTHAVDRNSAHAGRVAILAFDAVSAPAMSGLGPHR